jgi:hypothetical protein
MAAAEANGGRSWPPRPPSSAPAAASSMSRRTGAPGRRVGRRRRVNEGRDTDSPETPAPGPRGPHHSPRPGLYPPEPPPSTRAPSAVPPPGPPGPSPVASRLERARSKRRRRRPQAPSSARRVRPPRRRHPGHRPRPAGPRPDLRSRGRGRVQPSRGVIAGLMVGLMGAALLAPLRAPRPRHRRPPGRVGLALSRRSPSAPPSAPPSPISEWLVARLRPRPLLASAIRAATCLPVLIPLAAAPLRRRLRPDPPRRQLRPGPRPAARLARPHPDLLARQPPAAVPAPRDVGLAPLRAGGLPPSCCVAASSPSSPSPSPSPSSGPTATSCAASTPTSTPLLMVATLVGLGLGVWLGLTRPWRYDPRVERRLAVAQSRAIMLALLILAQLAVVANLVACLVLGLPTARGALRSSPPRHAHPPARPRRPRLVDQDRDGHSARARRRRLRRPRPRRPPRRPRGPRQHHRRGLRRLRPQEDLAAPSPRRARAAGPDHRWSETPAVQAALADAREHNVLLISVDALRADVLARTDDQPGRLPAHLPAARRAAPCSPAPSPPRPAPTSRSPASSPAASTPSPASTRPSPRACRQRPRRPRRHPQRGPALRRQDPDHPRPRHPRPPRQRPRRARRRQLQHQRPDHRARPRLPRARSSPPPATAKVAPFFLWLHYFDVHEHDEMKDSDRDLKALAARVGDPSAASAASTSTAPCSAWSTSRSAASSTPCAPRPVGPHDRSCSSATTARASARTRASPSTTAASSTTR